jgi:hypothetical protein
VCEALAPCGDGLRLRASRDPPPAAREFFETAI